MAGGEKKLLLSRNRILPSGKSKMKIEKMKSKIENRKKKNLVSQSVKIYNRNFFVSQKNTCCPLSLLINYYTYYDLPQ